MNRYGKVLVGAIVLLAACQPSEEDVANGDDPIRALSATVPSTRYTQTFWVQQSRDSAEVWQRARAVCQDADLGTRPNCALVREIAAFDDMAERSRSRAPSGAATIDPGWSRPGGPKHTLPAAESDSVSR